MIQLKKPPTAPGVLLARGVALAARHCADHDTGTPFGIDREVYAHHTVKDALLTAQHGKCAFCESRIDATSYGDVEHYRPKGGFQQRAKERLTTPGYYWLAYDWDNLFLACTICNGKHKKNLFPLLNPADRALSHTDPHSRERPLLLHPERDDPTRHLTYRRGTVVPRKHSRRGLKTIEILGLNRRPLREARRELYALLRVLKRTRAELRRRVAASPTLADQRDLDYAESRVRHHTSDRAPYAGMARVMLA